MKKITIYYADDDKDDLSFFEDAIAKIAFDSEKTIDLHLFTNGEELVESLKEYSNLDSIVFLDINMPKKSGYDLLQEIRSEPTTKKMPVIMFSTSSDSFSISKSQWLGASHYAIKPFEFNTLIKMLSDLIATDWPTYRPEKEMFIIR